MGGEFMKLAAFATWVPVCFGAIAAAQGNPPFWVIGVSLWAVGVLAQFTLGIWAISVLIARRSSTSNGHI